jgi:hypothetical protein
MILGVITRFYNQRMEFSKLTRKILLLFDQENIKILKDLKKKLKLFAKNIDESEMWIDQLDDKDTMKILDQTLETLKVFCSMMEKSYSSK